LFEIFVCVLATRPVSQVTRLALEAAAMSSALLGPEPTWAVTATAVGAAFPGAARWPLRLTEMSTHPHIPAYVSIVLLSLKNS
jgi:hypothetical protein